MTADTKIIRVEHLTAKYDENRVILDDISFDVKAGEIFIILGGSGCGKTTLLHHMIGLLTPAAGKIYIDNADIVRAQGPERLKILERIGVMYQSGALFGSMTLLENVRLPLEEFTKLPSDAMDIVARDKLKMVGLGDFCDYLPAEISGGMKKRAAIARAMALDPKILFMDELSAGLDPITSAQLDQLILDLSNILGNTFVLVTHELPSIFAIGQRCIMLHDKKIIAEGNPKTLRDDCDNVFVRQFFHRQPNINGEVKK